MRKTPISWSWEILTILGEWLLVAFCLPFVMLYCILAWVFPIVTTLLCYLMFFAFLGGVGELLSGHVTKGLLFILGAMSLWIFNSIVAGLVLATGNRQRVVHHVTDYKRGKRYSYETLNIGGVWMGPDGMVGGWEFRGDNAGLPWEFLVRFVEFFHERRQKQLVRSLIKDDRVQTTAGVVGTVVDVRSDDVILMVGDARDKEIRVSKSAIRRKLKKGETVLPTWKRKRKKPKPFFRFAEDPAAQPPAPGPH